MKQLHIVTYNILADAHVKRDRYPTSCESALDPVARRRRLLSEISGFDADVLCLQEVDKGMVSALAAELERYAVHYAPKLNGRDGLAILVRKDSPLEIEKVVPLYATGLSEDNALVALVAYAAPIAIASTHLRWRKDDTPWELHVGLRQLEALLDHADQLRSSHPAWLVAGDFNANSQSTVIRTAEARGFQISCRSQRPWDTTNINRRRRKIDYVLHTPAHFHPSPKKLPRLERDTPMPSLVFPSDHLPLGVTFEVAS